jgi:hypothetical protein
VSMSLTPAPASAYRTHSDAGLVQSVTPPVWSVPMTFAVDATAFTSAEREGVRRAIARALSNWTSVSCADVHAEVEVSRSSAVIGDGISQIVWVEDWAERGYDSDSLAVTETVYSTQEGSAEIVEADIYLKLLRVRWSSGSSASDLEARMIEAVVTHELGHAFGLAHSCGEPWAPICDEQWLGETTMSPLYSHSQTVLAADDRAGICALYPRDSTCSPTAECRAGEVCREGQCVDPCADMECADGSRCIAGECESSCDACDDCESDAECSGATFCRGARCVTALRSGEPCSRDEQCGSAQCNSGACGLEGCTDSTCSGRYGEACEVGSECDSSVCVRSSTGDSFCSRSCDARNVCPPSYDCKAVDADQVCVPSPSGCSVSWSAAPTRPCWFAFLFLVCGLRHRRKQAA